MVQKYLLPTFTHLVVKTGSICTADLSDLSLCTVSLKKNQQDCRPLLPKGHVDHGTRSLKFMK